MMRNLSCPNTNEFNIYTFRQLTLNIRKHSCCKSKKHVGTARQIRCFTLLK